MGHKYSATLLNQIKTVDDIPFIRILGTRVHIACIQDVIAVMDHWIQGEPHQNHHVVNTGMHGIMEAHKDPEFRAILDSADLLAIDGILAIIIARLHGFQLKKKDTGPDLLWQFSEVAHSKGYKYFLYGDTEDTLKSLSTKLNTEFPNVKVVGHYSPPFRPLTSEEDEQIVHTIIQARPDVLWVGLGMPKQERWIFEHRNKLNVPVLVGAGASFKFLSGTVSRGPSWIRNLGFEWLWRLVHEPRRIWRRVFIDAPHFIGLLVLQFIGLKKYG